VDWLAAEFVVPRVEGVPIGISVFGKAFELSEVMDVTVSEEAFGTTSAARQLLQAARRPA